MIESGTMKRLITLILSAVLLCPMWAGGQTITTPSISGQFHYSGYLSIMVLQNNYLISLGSFECNRITDLRINILSPNSASPIKGVSGIFNCPGGGWAPFSGTLVAMAGANPNYGNSTTTSYTGTFTLGLAQMSCTFPADLTYTNCVVFVIGSIPSSVSSTPLVPFKAGDGNFTITSTP